MAVEVAANSYCFDTSVFIDGMGKRYPPSVFRSAWAHVERAINEGRIVAPQEVFNEVRRYNDDVHKWVKARKRFILTEDDTTQRIAADVLGAFPGFVAKGNERACADPFVIAMAKSRGFPVVTQEEWADKHKLSKPKIPNACKAFNVEWLNFVGFLEREGVSF